VQGLEVLKERRDKEELARRLVTFAHLLKKVTRYSPRDPGRGAAAPCGALGRRARWGAVPRVRAREAPRNIIQKHH